MVSRASLAASLAVAALGAMATSSQASHASSRVVPGARAASAGAPVVQTECGPVLGTFNSTFSVAAFRGIPYAGAFDKKHCQRRLQLWRPPLGRSERVLGALRVVSRCTPRLPARTPRCLRGL